MIFSEPRVETSESEAFASVMEPPTVGANHLSLDGEKLGQGLAQLVLTVVKLLHELLEREAVRRMERGSLGEDELERLGAALLCQAEEIDRLRDRLGLREADLNLDLGPLGKLF